MDNNVFDIRARHLENASPILAQALETIWDQYGLDICLTLLVFYCAKGVYFSQLTEDEQRALLERCKRSLDNSYALIKSEYPHGEES